MIDLCVLYVYTYILLVLHLPCLMKITEVVQLGETVVWEILFKSTLEEQNFAFPLLQRDATHASLFFFHN